MYLPPTPPFFPTLPSVFRVHKRLNFPQSKKEKEVKLAEIAGIDRAFTIFFSHPLYLFDRLKIIHNRVNTPITVITINNRCVVRKHEQHLPHTKARGVLVEDPSNFPFSFFFLFFIFIFKPRLHTQTQRQKLSTENGLQTYKSYLRRVTPLFRPNQSSIMINQNVLGGRRFGEL